MSIEKPQHGLNEQTPFSVDKIAAPVERDLSEDEQQTIRENASRQKFIQDWVMASTFTPEQRVSLAEYVNAQPGAWREYNGTDFRVVAANVVGGVWKVTFGVFFDDYEAQRIDVEIPVSK